MKRSLVTLATLALVAGLFASAAFAHADLASSTPAAGSTVAAAPAVVTLNFSEALTPASTGKVTGPGGVVVSTGSQLSTTNAKQLTITLRSGLGNGLYTVSYHTIAMDDMDTDDDSFIFGVGVPVPSTSTEPLTNTTLVLVLFGLAAAAVLVSTIALRAGRHTI